MTAEEWTADSLPVRRERTVERKRDILQQNTINVVNNGGPESLRKG